MRETGLEEMRTAEVIVFIEGAGKVGVETDPTGGNCPVCGVLGGSWCAVSHCVVSDGKMTIGYIHKERLEKARQLEKEDRVCGKCGSKMEIVEQPAKYWKHEYRCPKCGRVELTR